MSRAVSFSDETYLMGLRNRDPQVLQAIYQRAFPSLRQHVCTHGGSQEDAEDVFQETMLVLYRKANQPDFVLTSQFHTFLLGVGRKIWLKKASRRGRRPETRLPAPEAAATPDWDAEIACQERYQLYREKLAELDEDSQRVLRLFCEGKSMREIAEIMGYKSEGYAKKRKFQCKQKLMALIRADQRYQEMCGE